MVQEELNEEKQLWSDQERRSRETQSNLNQEVEELSKKLLAVQAEREDLLHQMESSALTSTQEVAELRSRATSVSHENDALQGALHSLKQEKEQLLTKMEELHAQILAVQEKLSEQEKLITQLKIEKREGKAELKQEMQQLEQNLQELSEERTRVEAQTVTSTQQQQSSPSTAAVTTTTLSQLAESAEQLQEWFKKLQRLEDDFSLYMPYFDMRRPAPNSVPVAGIAKVVNSFHEPWLQEIESLKGTLEYLQTQVRFYNKLFKELVNKDLAVYEEMRLQDLLLCRAQAPDLSIQEADFGAVWEHRLVELLERRQGYLHWMPSIWNKLLANLSSVASILATELQDHGQFIHLFEGLWKEDSTSKQPLDDFLRTAREQRCAALQPRQATVQAITEEHNSILQELKLQEAQAQSRLQEERSKNATLLQSLEGAPVKTELSLLRDNQQLANALQQTEAQVKALRDKVVQLEEIGSKADCRISNHKQATQLLQTELQDSRAQVEEKEKAIQNLKTKLRESEKNASPSAVELKELRSTVFKVQLEMNIAEEKHQQEIKKMNTLLNYKEDSLRKLKEMLRKKSQQDADESFQEGKDIQAKLINPKGQVITSSLSMEKKKLEEEVQQLRMKIVELESLVSSQAAEVSKWKGRAIKLKGKPKIETDKLSLPCVPTKRAPAVTLDSSSFFNSPKKFLVTPKKVLQSPRKFLDSPKIVPDSPKSTCLDSPKSRFFGVGDSSEMLMKTCPKQFFDNSGLGTLPEMFSEAPPTPNTETGAATVPEDKKEDSWPQSPKQEDICKTQ